MKRFCEVFAFGCMVFMMAASSCAEERIEVEIDRFYGGLAGIIERNMDVPDRCVQEVEQYYRNHRDLIERTRRETEKGIEALSDFFEETSTSTGTAPLSEERIKSLEAKAERAGIDTREKAMPDVPPGQMRYADALEKFTMKYPHQGMKIAFKAMEFLPQSLKQGAMKNE